MLFELFFMLKDSFSPFNLFRYVSFRVIASMVTSLMVCLLLYPWFIRKLQERQIGQVIRAEGPESHYSKAGTPTMGGVLIVLSVVVSTLLWADLSNPYVGMLLIITVGFGVVGFIDDSMKLRGKSSAGLSGKIRLLIEFGLFDCLKNVAGIHLIALPVTVSGRRVRCISERPIVRRCILSRIC